jgi:hypothetical protein
MWCIPNLTPEFKERMEDILVLYAKPYDPKEPVVCFDEKSKQLLKDSRALKATQPGKTRIRDYEYVRNGTRNIFVAMESKGGKRMTEVTKCRKKTDYARFVEKVIDSYPDADTIHFVQDNLNTHFITSLIEAFGVRKAKRLWKRLTLHYTPKHASWLNMAEIEIGVLSRQCIKGRIPSAEVLERKIAAWEQRRNTKRCGINWKFTKAKARKVFPSLYPTKLNG